MELFTVIINDKTGQTHRFEDVYKIQTLSRDAETIDIDLETFKLNDVYFELVVRFGTKSTFSILREDIHDIALIKQR